MIDFQYLKTIKQSFFTYWKLVLFLLLFDACEKDNPGDVKIILPEYANIENREYLLDSVQLRNKKVALIVTYDIDYEDWATRMFEVAKIYLPALENYLDYDYPHSEHLIINGANGNDDGIAGFYSYQYIQSEYTSADYCGNILHEICHYWFNGSAFNQIWFYEGAVEFNAYAMIKEGILDIPMVETGIQDQIDSYDIESHGVVDMPLIPNYALENLVSGSQTGYCFSKSVKLHYVWYKGLGAETYRDFLRSLLKQSPVKGDEALLSKVNEFQNNDWKTYFTGWLYQGSYTDVTPDDFWDSDIDGIMDVDETFLGTNKAKTDTDGDGIPDGKEIELGLDPLVANSISDLQNYGPFTDGLDDEWQYYSFTSFVDGDSDASSTVHPDYDMDSMRYLIKNDICYFSISLKNELADRANLQLVLMIDTGLNMESDFQFFYEYGPGKKSYMFDSNADAWFYFDNFPTCKQAFQKQVEFQMPLSLLGNSNFYIAPRLKNVSTGEYYDLWVKYELIEVE